MKIGEPITDKTYIYFLWFSLCNSSQFKSIYWQKKNTFIYNIYKLGHFTIKKQINEGKKKNVGKKQKMKTL